MPYATQDDLLQRMSLQDLTQLTDDDRTGSPSDTIVNGELVVASGLVDSYCRNRYQTPLQPSETVTNITRDIAVYSLYGRRPGKMRDEVRQRYQDALKFLQDISAGKASFDQPTADSPQTTSAGPVPARCTGQRMTDDDLEGYV